MSNIIGEMVKNRKNETGIIEAYKDGRIVVRFGAREATFQCPKAFSDGFLTAENKNLQNELITEGKLLDEKEAEKKGLLVAKLQQQRKDEAENRGTRGPHKSNISKGMVFRTHAEALNECFGYNYKHYQKAYKQIDDKYGVWFPSIAKKVSGEYVAADTSFGWLNILCENGTVILEKNVEDPSKNTARNDAGNIFVFSKFDGEEVYTFIGLFTSNPVPTKDGFRYELIGTQIDLDNMKIIR